MDSGTIGVVSDELITKMSLSEEASIGTLLQTTGHWIDFEEDFTVSRSDDGLLAIGRIFIDT